MSPPSRALSKRFWLAFGVLAALHAASGLFMIQVVRDLRRIYQEMGIGEASLRGWPGFLFLALGGLWILTVILWSRDQERKGLLSDEALGQVRRRCWAYLLGMFLVSQVSAWGSLAYQVHRVFFAAMCNSSNYPSPP